MLFTSMMSVSKGTFKTMTDLQPEEPTPSVEFNRILPMILPLVLWLVCRNIFSNVVPAYVSGLFDGMFLTLIARSMVIVARDLSHTRDGLSEMRKGAVIGIAVGCMVLVLAYAWMLIAD